MIRGTTPTLTFKLPFAVDQLAYGFVTFAQNDEVIIDRALADCWCDGYEIRLQLTQEETLSMNENLVTEIQIRAKTLNGDVIASNIIRESTERILKDGVI